MHAKYAATLKPCSSVGECVCYSQFIFFEQSGLSTQLLLTIGTLLQLLLPFVPTGLASPFCSRHHIASTATICTLHQQIAYHRAGAIGSPGRALALPIFWPSELNVHNAQ